MCPLSNTSLRKRHVPHVPGIFSKPLTGCALSHLQSPQTVAPKLHHWQAMQRRPVNRRAILAGTAGLLALPSYGHPNKATPEQVYLFATADYRVRMTLEFYDRYRTQELQFAERSSGRPFCVSSAGQENRNCVKRFDGSVAIARYQVVPLTGSATFLSLREYVRIIDRSDALRERPPFERTIEAQGGWASDIQAFGYDQSDGHEAERKSATDHVWCLLRQDLFLKDKSSPFLVVHWKHTLDAIRVLDVIPGTGTARVQVEVR
jgi:hypothetical protein